MWLHHTGPSWAHHTFWTTFLKLCVDSATYIAWRPRLALQLQKKTKTALHAAGKTQVCLDVKQKIRVRYFPVGSIFNPTFYPNCRSLNFEIHLFLSTKLAGEDSECGRVAQATNNMMNKNIFIFIIGSPCGGWPSGHTKKLSYRLFNTFTAAALLLFCQSSGLRAWLSLRIFFVFFQCIHKKNAYAKPSTSNLSMKKKTKKIKNQSSWRWAGDMILT